MATKPKTVTLTNSSVDVLNAIRNSASTSYKDYVPIATPDAEVIRQIGAVIMDYPALQNEFLNALINRIGRVIVTSKSYENPLSMFKKGVLDMGESIEEIFVQIAKPYSFDVSIAEQEVFKRETPGVRSSFHIMNYQKFYKATVEPEQLRQAFLSIEGVTDLITKITESMYNGANYDEFITMKYMLAKRISDGLLTSVSIPEVTASNMKSIISTVKGISNKLEFLSDKYNLAQVKTTSKKDEQYLLVTAEFEAMNDVEVLASAFNMNKAEYLGHRVLVDGFGDLDTERLATLFDGDSTYTEFDAETIAKLKKIPCVLVDKDFFMVWDKLTQFTEQYNAQGMYWNYFYHIWKVFSVSPFANAVMFVPEA